MTTHLSPPVGNEISCVMHGIKDEILNNPKFIKDSLLEGLNIDKFNIIGEVAHEFEPRGFTVMFLLSESHATIHTYPEYNALAFHIYTCRGKNDGENTFNHLKEKINPKRIDMASRPIIVKEGALT